MDKVNSQFYKNVGLLTAIFEPHEEFKKHFKEVFIYTILKKIAI